MQAAIESLARVAGRVGRPELDDAVRSAREAAGIITSNVEENKRHDGETGDNPPRSRSTVLLQTDESSTTSTSQFPSKSLAGRLSSSSGHQLAFLQPRPGDGTSGQQQEHAATGQQLGHHRGRMSPRLTYGIFLERPLFKLVNPPIDIMPFLDQSTTLSSVVFWTSLVWGVKLLQAALDGNGQAVATADKIFGHIGPISPHRAIINGMHARLSYRQLGYIDPDHPGYDPEGGLRIQSLIAHSCAVDGTPLGTYLRPDAAEEFIRNRLGTGFRVVELAIQGLGTSEDLLRVHMLVNKMIRSSVCLGDGPRWRKDGLEKTLSSWVRSSAVPSEE